MCKRLEVLPMGRKFTFVILCVLSLSGNAFSRELEIGHLETADDPDGLNWLFFHCVERGMTLDCDIVQTLMHHELAVSQRDKYIEEAIKENPPDETCSKGKPFDKDKFAEERNSIVASAKRGMSPDGRPISAAAHEC